MGATFPLSTGFFRAVSKTRENLNKTALFKRGTMCSARTTFMIIDTLQPDVFCQFTRIAACDRRFFSFEKEARA